MASEDRRTRREQLSDPRTWIATGVLSVGVSLASVAPFHAGTNGVFGFLVGFMTYLVSDGVLGE